MREGVSGREEKVREGGGVVVFRGGVVVFGHVIRIVMSVMWSGVSIKVLI